MTDELLTRQQYLLEKRQGYADDEAALRAGFAGRPGADARRLIRLADREARGDYEGLARKAEAFVELVSADPSTRAYRKAKLEEAVEVAESLREELELRIEALEALQCE